MSGAALFATCGAHAAQHSCRADAESVCGERAARRERYERMQGVFRKPAWQTGQGAEKAMV